MVPPGEPTMLVGHSQGGLIVQRYLAMMVRAARARELAPVRRIVLSRARTTARSSCCRCAVARTFPRGAPASGRRRGRDRVGPPGTVRGSARGDR
ncbi:hypothetical protein LO772_34780 [Yinghuangia sp. ASG 101]|uniref:hypothetical protein n=1 Tax=Yinghuangia sp. ASG 101 TaxID=2896848 RepID=UPI001E4BBCF2|nr:hypothetical protein [Yinghuangia sp. ASG 101]UGQ11872.1 hypothetical protein LO772_34780 [Yinghuangia sp. ASG 101]